MRRNIFIIITLLFLVITSTQLFSQSKKAIKLHKRATKKLTEWKNPHEEWNHVGSIKIDTFLIKSGENIVEFELSTPLSYLPIREQSYQLTINTLQECLGRKFKDYTISVKTDDQSLESLIPNIYRKSIDIDSNRFNPLTEIRIPIVRKVSNTIPSFGLYNKNIALWHSHGWFYEAKLDRWEWQRARLFSTIEDIFPMTFVLPYIAPMLENAGANVFLPRERDTQINEVIVDNDRSTGASELILHEVAAKAFSGLGFMQKDTLFVGENPFTLGTHIKMKSTTNLEKYIEYIPEIPEEGRYAVYISYVISEGNVDDASYTVFHTGGKTEYLVNQRIGGSTWIFLGTFHFEKGKRA